MMYVPGSPSKRRAKRSSGGWYLAVFALASLLGVAYLLARSSSPTPSRARSPAVAVAVDKPPVDDAIVAAATEHHAAAGDLVTETFTKTVLTPGDGPKPMPNQYVTVEADLYLADPSAEGGKGTAIWSTHEKAGFLFPAASPPVPFTYQVRGRAQRLLGNWLGCRLQPCNPPP